MKKLLFIILASLLLIGCKPKQVISERINAVSDSTALMKVKEQLAASEKTVERLKGELNRTKEENIRLQSETSSHTINYDTNAPVNPETGQYPKASEIITSRKKMLDKQLKEIESLKSEHAKEVFAMQNKINNLELELSQHKKTNLELKKAPTDPYKWRYIFGIGVLVIFIILYFKKPITSWAKKILVFYF